MTETNESSALPEPDEAIIEEIARALHQHDRGGSHGYTWEQEHWQKPWLDAARLVYPIVASHVAEQSPIREPRSLRGIIIQAVRDEGHHGEDAVLTVVFEQVHKAVDWTPSWDRVRVLINELLRSNPPVLSEDNYGRFSVLDSEGVSRA